MAMALNMLFGLPLHFGYLIGSVVVIPSSPGFTFISRFQQFTQFCWLALQLLPFIFILIREHHVLQNWIDFPVLLQPAMVLSISFSSAPSVPYCSHW